MDLSNKRVAILVDNYFEQAEFEEPLDALKEAGLGVDVISTEGRQLTAMEHAMQADRFQADIVIADAEKEDYDALILPGGAINADSLRMNDDAREWVKYFMSNDLPVAAICHAPWLLVSSGVINGRKLTSFYTIQDDIRNAGGEWIDRPVVVDKNLITSRMPDDIPQFNYTIIDMLSQDDGDGIDGGEGDETIDILGKANSRSTNKYYSSLSFRQKEGEEDDEDQTYDSKYLRAFIKMHEYKLRSKIWNARARSIRYGLTHFGR